MSLEGCAGVPQVKKTAEERPSTLGSCAWAKATGRGRLLAGQTSRGTEVLADWGTWLPQEEGQLHRRVVGSLSIICGGGVVKDQGLAVWAEMPFFLVQVEEICEDVQMLPQTTSAPSHPVSPTGR